MATERLIIEVREKGSAKANKNIAGIGKGATQAGKGVQLLKGALVALGGAAAIRQLVNLVDTFTNVQNRLRLVTTGTAQLTAVTSRLLQVSNRTRSSFEGTAQLFARTARATRNLGTSQEEVLQFTESLNQAVILSGASAIEAEQGIRQLSQGLGKGRLDGDELRSVLENLSFVGDILAEKMGVARGALRDLGAAGKITPTVILNAFKAAREELEERFAKTIPTIGQSFQVLENNVLALTGALEQSTGVAGILSRTILGLANNIGTVARILGAAGLLGVIVALQFGFKKLIVSLRVFNALLLANPVGALVKALVIVGSLLVAFADKISLGGEGATTLADIFTATFNIISSVITDTISLMGILAASFSGARVNLSGFASFFTNTFVALIKILDAFIGIFTGLVVGVIKGISALPTALTTLFSTGFDGIIAVVKTSVNTIIELLNVVLEASGANPLATFALTPIQDSAVGAFKDIGNAVKEGFLTGLNSKVIESTIDKIRGATVGVTQERLGKEIVAKASQEFAFSQLGKKGEASNLGTGLAKKGAKTKTFADIKKELEQENSLLKLNSVERERQAAIFQAETTLKRSLTAAEREELGALLDTNKALAARADILDELQAPQIALAQGQAALNGLLKEGTITAEQYTQKLRELSLAALQADTSLEGGLKRGLLSIGQEFTNLSTLAESTLVNAFKGAEDALVEFAQTGKLSVSGLVDSIFADLARLAVRGAITGPIAGLLSGQAAGSPAASGGGGGGSLGGLAGIASSLFGGGGAQPSGAPAAGGAGGGAGLLAAASRLFGFRNGGDFNVGGSGGPDSQLVAFRASPGENVQINKPGQGGGRSVNVVMNINTPDADSFQRNQGQILAKTQAGLQRANARNN